MTSPQATIVPLATYRNETPLPFCPGCGHGPILDHLNRALVQLKIDPRKVVLVSDIGCSGLSDQYFVTNAFHGLHGRSVTYASGIKLARPELTVIVLMGDGGTGIGGTHLISAARRNIGITVLVFNNFNFGMTGGQHSTTTPFEAITTTTPSGNLERPLDICATVAVNGANYAFRGTSFDADLSNRFAEAISCDGFSLLDVWELCTAYFVPKNRLSKRSLQAMLDDLGFQTGLVAKRSRPEYTEEYRRAVAPLLGAPTLSTTGLQPCYRSHLERRVSLVAAGTAGGKVGTAVRLAACAGILSDLWAIQRNDYPITVKSGHSIAELILGPEPIHFSAITYPDALAILSPEGCAKASRYLLDMRAEGMVFTLPRFRDLDCRAPVTVLDPCHLDSRLGGEHLALAVIAAMAAELRLFPIQALHHAVDLENEAFRPARHDAIDAGLELLQASR